MKTEVSFQEVNVQSGEKIIRPNYANENNEGAIIADLPSSPIEKGNLNFSKWLSSILFNRLKTTFWDLINYYSKMN